MEKVHFYELSSYGISFFPTLLLASNFSKDYSPFFARLLISSSMTVGLYFVATIRNTKSAAIIPSTEAILPTSKWSFTMSIISRIKKMIVESIISRILMRLPSLNKKPISMCTSSRMMINSNNATASVEKELTAEKSFTIIKSTSVMVNLMYSGAF